MPKIGWWCHFLTFTRPIAVTAGINQAKEDSSSSAVRWRPPLPYDTLVTGMTLPTPILGQVYIVLGWICQPHQGTLLYSVV